MKFSVAALLAALATTCFAQSHGATIISPPDNSSVTPGQVVPFEIQIDPSFAVSLYTAGFFFTKPHWNWFYRMVLLQLRFSQLLSIIIHTVTQRYSTHPRPRASLYKKSTSLFPLLPTMIPRSRSRVAAQWLICSTTLRMGKRQVIWLYVQVVAQDELY